VGYGAVRASFERALDLPDEYIDRMYGSPVVRHFFTDDEIDVLRQRWSRTG
jgi:hypothetical protein